MAASIFSPALGQVRVWLCCSTCGQAAPRSLLAPAGTPVQNGMEGHTKASFIRRSKAAGSNNPTGSDPSCVSWDRSGPKCLKTLRTIPGSSMVAMIFTGPPYVAYVEMSHQILRLKRWARINVYALDFRHSPPSACRPGTTHLHHLLLGENTPCNLVKLALAPGIRAAN